MDGTQLTSVNTPDDDIDDREFLHLKHTSLAKCTVMGGQQVCNQACRPCNDGGVTVTTQ